MAADPYITLGVKKDATSDDIQKAYRRLAKKLHPDLNPGNKTAEEKFKEVSAAYDMLSDPEKRARFDRGESTLRERNGHASNIIAISPIKAAGRPTPTTPAFPISAITPAPRIFSPKSSAAKAVAGAARMCTTISILSSWMPSMVASNLSSSPIAPRLTSASRRARGTVRFCA